MATLGDSNYLKKNMTAFTTLSSSKIA